jgi:hypothetical protein
VGLLSGAKKLLSGEAISIQRMTHTSPAADLLSGDRQSYVGRWRSAGTELTISPDGTVEYRHLETVGDTTRSDALSGPIDSFDGASFAVGMLGKTRRFDVTEPPRPADDGRMAMTVDGERLMRE